MITPTKGIAPERALLTVAAQAALAITEPMTVSQAWSAFRSWRSGHANAAAVPFSWFVLGLDVLFALGVLSYDNGLLRKVLNS